MNLIKELLPKQINGLMFFGGVGGLTSFDPNDLYHKYRLCSSNMLVNYSVPMGFNLDCF
jgi:hypothetical protein